MSTKCKSFFKQKDQKVFNPQTERYIIVGGSTFRHLLENKKCTYDHHHNVLIPCHSDNNKWIQQQNEYEYSQYPPQYYSTRLYEPQIQYVKSEYPQYEQYQYQYEQQPGSMQNNNNNITNTNTMTIIDNNNNNNNNNTNNNNNNNSAYFEIDYFDYPFLGCVKSIQGRRDDMEDTHTIARLKYGKAAQHEFITPDMRDETIEFYGLFDGHGGSTTAEELENYFGSRLLQAVWKADVDMNKKESTFIQDTIYAIQEAFIDMDQSLWRSFQLRKQHSDKQKKKKETKTKTKTETKTDEPDTDTETDETETESGSTAIILIRRHNYIFVANLGDSRLVLFNEKGQIIIETMDHKPEKQEKERIEAAGGYVTESESGTKRVNGVLSLSRALGDQSLKQNKSTGNNTPNSRVAPVIAMPTVYVYKLKDPSEQVTAVLACDGLWDKITSQEVVDLYVAKQKANETRICDALVDAAYQLGSTDNISVMIVPLPFTMMKESQQQQQWVQQQQQQQSIQQSKAKTTKEKKGGKEDELVYEVTVLEFNNVNPQMNMKFMVERVTLYPGAEFDLRFQDAIQNFKENMNSKDKKIWIHAKDGSVFRVIGTIDANDEITMVSNSNVKQ